MWWDRERIDWYMRAASWTDFHRHLATAIENHLGKDERILELSLEGHRFYDLLRWGELATRFQTLTREDPNFKKFISATDYEGFTTNKHEWLPIPINEINSNPNIKQNPGY